jgi:hypothetical protein
MLRVVKERPVSSVTSQFVAWCCDWLVAAGETALVFVWDNATWDLSA